MDRLDKIVAAARRNREEREKGYRERALKLYPWVCGRCSRAFNHATLQLLEVHHKDHNHDNNPTDGSNWELLCTYCHENEHARQLDNDGRMPTPGGESTSLATHKPFANLKDKLKPKT
jgi:HNH endonuclease